MRIISTLEELENTEPAAIAIGKFDGVHLGHRKLLKAITGAEGLLPVVLTFSPAPEVLFGIGDGRQLLTKEEKRELLKKLGIGLLVEYPMNRESAAVEPADFIREYLVKRLNARLIAAGSDLSFGNRGKGDFTLLEQMKAEGGYETRQVEKLFWEGAEISSSRIRGLIAEAKVAEAGEMLGESYRICGRVEHGEHLGHSLGFPTINVYPAEDKLLPPFGVYFTEVIAEGQRYRGVTNIGIRPTVSAEKRISVETYLPEFSGDLYGKETVTELKAFHRREQRFDSVEELKRQLAKDTEAMLAGAFV